MASSEYMTEMVMSAMSRVYAEGKAAQDAFSTKLNSMESKIDVFDDEGLSAAERIRHKAEGARAMVKDLVDRQENENRYSSVSEMSANVSRRISDKQKALRALGEAKTTEHSAPTRGTYTDPVTGETKFADEGQGNFGRRPEEYDWMRELMPRENMERLEQMRRDLNGGARDKLGGSVDRSTWANLTSEPDAFKDMSRKEHKEQYDRFNEAIKSQQSAIWNSLNAGADELVERTAGFAREYAKGVNENKRAAAKAQQEASAAAIRKQETDLKKSIASDQQTLAQAGDSSLSSGRQARITNAVDEQRPM